MNVNHHFRSFDFLIVRVILSAPPFCIACLFCLRCKLSQIECVGFLGCAGFCALCAFRQLTKSGGLSGSSWRSAALLTKASNSRTNPAYARAAKLIFGGEIGNSIRFFCGVNTSGLGLNSTRGNCMQYDQSTSSWGYIPFGGGDTVDRTTTAESPSTCD